MPSGAGPIDKAALVAPELARLKEAPVPIADAGPSSTAQLQPNPDQRGPEVQREWISAKIEHRRRARRGEVQAPEDGVLSWQAEPQRRVRRGEAIGTLQGKTTKTKHVLFAPKDGILVPKERNGANAKKSKRVATILASQGYLQAVVSDARPEKTWSCELFDEASGLKAPCTVVTVVSRGSRYRVTATTESMAFDTLEEAVVRLSPPR
jgi:hypothetical protein